MSAVPKWKFESPVNATDPFPLDQADWERDTRGKGTNLFKRVAMGKSIHD